MVEKRSVDEIISAIFDKMKNKRHIIAYKTKVKDIYKLSNLTPNKDTVVFDLSISKEIEDYFCDKYNIKKLPCLISYGINIYDDENMEDALKKRDTAEYLYYENMVNELIKRNRIFIFIKGSPERPECRYTRQLMEIFDEHDLTNGEDYGYFNILSNIRLRTILKKINDKSTYPQIFINQKFMGGLDDLRNLIAQGIILK